jgi:hypothetical protein
MRKTTSPRNAVHVQVGVAHIEKHLWADQINIVGWTGHRTEGNRVDFQCDAVHLSGHSLASILQTEIDGIPIDESKLSRGRVMVVSIIFVDVVVIDLIAQFAGNAEEEGVVLLVHRERS